MSTLQILLACIQCLEFHIHSTKQGLPFDCVREHLNKNTPIRGVLIHLLKFSSLYSLCGGHKPDRSEFIPVYMIYAALDRSDCGFEAKSDDCTCISAR